MVQDYTRRLREEQDAEFQRSLQADREREEGAAAAAAEQAAAAAAAAQAEADARHATAPPPPFLAPGGCLGKRSDSAG